MGRHVIFSESILGESSNAKFSEYFYQFNFFEEKKKTKRNRIGSPPRLGDLEGVSISSTSPKGK
jgi:hypothetical protein